MVGRLTTRPSLVDLAHDELVAAIFDGSLAPGAAVSIDDLAASLGTSTTPVREALARAASEGLLSVELNKGYRVTPLLTADEYRQLLQARCMLEGHAACISRFTTDDCEALEDAVVRIRAATERRKLNTNAFSRADLEFHAIIVAAGGNRFLLDAWEGLHAFMHVHRLYALYGMPNHDDAGDEHAALLALVRGGDREKLAQAVEAHLEYALNSLTELMEGR